VNRVGRIGLMGIAVVACGAAIVGGRGGNGDGGPTPAQVAAVAAAPDRAATCAVPPRVPGRLPAHWKERSTAVGPVHLYKVDEYEELAAEEFRPLPGTGGKRYRPEKQLVLVRGGPVTLSIARSQRDVARLLYNGAPFANGYALADGTPTVTFGDCGVAVSQWSGAFVVAGARCVALTARDAAGKIVGRGRIGFGRKGC
jgi:hypothetical protein